MDSAPRAVKTRFKNLVHSVATVRSQLVAAIDEDADDADELLLLLFMVVMLLEVIFLC